MTVTHRTTNPRTLTHATEQGACEMGGEDGCENPATFVLDAPATYVKPMLVCSDCAEQEQFYFGTSVPALLPAVIYDKASAEQRKLAQVATVNLAAECRAVDSGLRCQVGTDRGVFVVPSGSHKPWQYALTARAVGGLVHIACRAEPSPDHPFAIIPASIQSHARRAEPGRVGCQHAAACARFLSDAGLVAFVDGRWHSTPKAEALAGEVAV